MCSFCNTPRFSMSRLFPKLPLIFISSPRHLSLQGLWHDVHVHLPLKSFLSKPVPFPQATQMNDVIGWILSGNVHLLSHITTFYYSPEDLNHGVKNVKSQEVCCLWKNPYLSFTDDEEGVSSSALSDDVFSITVVSLKTERRRRR